VCFVVSPESARQSLAVVVKCEELIMITGRESCSCAQSVVGQPAALKLGKAKARAVASRELESASLRETGSGQPIGWGEASTGREESARGTHQAPRGERRQRAPKQPSGTWETLPETRPARAGKRTPGSHNRRAVGNRESDGLIVAASFRSSREGAKEPWPESSRVRGTWS
jgi:hypothetical protein